MGRRRGLLTTVSHKKTFKRDHSWINRGVDSVIVCSNEIITGIDCICIKLRFHKNEIFYLYESALSN